LKRNRVTAAIASPCTYKLFQPSCLIHCLCQSAANSHHHHLHNGRTPRHLHPITGCWC
jgi:hypothetical protein